MDKNNKTSEELEELENKNRNGTLVKEILDKVNEIIEELNK